MEYQSAESDRYKELIRHLAYEWAKVELPGVRLTYADYIRVIGLLLTATQCEERTTYLFMAILNQAVRLGHSSDWVEREVRFEIMAEHMDRLDLILIYLRHTNPVDDDTLDTYNERMSRFPSSSKANQSA